MQSVLDQLKIKPKPKKLDVITVKLNPQKKSFATTCDPTDARSQPKTDWCWIPQGWVFLTLR